MIANLSVRRTTAVQHNAVGEIAEHLVRQFVGRLASALQVLRHGTNARNDGRYDGA